MGSLRFRSHLRDLTYREFEVSHPIEMIPNFVNCDVLRRAENGDLRGKYAPRESASWCMSLTSDPVKRVMDVVEIFDRVQKKVPSRFR